MSEDRQAEALSNPFASIERKLDIIDERLRYAIKKIAHAQDAVESLREEAARQERDKLTWLPPTNIRR